MTSKTHRRGSAPSAAGPTRERTMAEHEDQSTESPRPTSEGIRIIGAEEAGERP